MKLLQVNSDVLFIMIIIVAIVLVIAFFSVYLFFLFQKRKLHLMRQQEQLRETYEQEILKTQIEIRDQTMKDVGRELHDHIGQVLTVIKIELGQMQEEPAKGAMDDRIGRTKELVSEVIQDLRSLSKTLNADLIQQVGLQQSIAHELARVNKLGLISCHLEVQGDPYTMPAEKEFVVFRIMQENLNNILKHARAKTVNTVLRYDEGSFVFSQKDDGIGFDQDEVMHRSVDGAGSGLLNMHRRAEMVHASLRIESLPGKGTALTLKMELQTAKTATI